MTHASQLRPAHPDSESDQQALDIMLGALKGKALRPPVIGQKHRQCVYITREAAERLNQIAESFGYTYNGRGNVSMLLEGIGTGVVRVTPLDALGGS